ncbi:phosphopantetheine adenylyltransferase [Anopheles sinensis]|uniref:Phosphopantetheine adenylyltransferase n=1 Tax=Anopheles sinensis TaxID=74873 RepID=A0A084VVQ0_ANOSI|nr:phosphopantetheine adenylyltransferase [Anopheles sinensis]
MSSVYPGCAGWYTPTFIPLVLHPSRLLLRRDFSGIRSRTPASGLPRRVSRNPVRKQLLVDSQHAEIKRKQLWVEWSCGVDDARQRQQAAQRSGATAKGFASALALDPFGS